ncbi:MAG TPA: hypothetical protein PLS21_08125 [Synergistales bacterium]|nr:hypothetical protein [Synergistales bacterium]
MIPSVTTVLSPWSDFSMVPDHVLEAAAVIAWPIMDKPLFTR